MFKGIQLKRSADLQPRRTVPHCNYEAIRLHSSSMLWRLALLSLLLASSAAEEHQDASKHLHSDVWAWLNRAASQIGSSTNPECEKAYGLSFIEGWRGGAQQLCINSSTAVPGQPAAAAINASAAQATTITAYPKTFGIKRWLAGESRNLVLNTSSYLLAMGTSVDRDVTGQRGALQASCKLKLDGLEPYLNTAFSKMWPSGVLQGDQAEVVQTACSPGNPNVVEHPVLLFLRHDITNVYHFLEEVLMLFLTLAATKDEQVQQQGIQVWVVDKYGPGHYMAVWRRLSRPFKVRFLSEEPLPPGTCLRYVLHNPWAHGISIMSLFGVGVPTECRSSPIMIAASHWLRSMFQGLMLPRVQPGGHTRDGQPVHITVKTIVWISRTNLEAVKTVTGQTSDWGTARMYGNEADLILDLTQAVLEWNEKACFRQGVKPGATAASLRRQRRRRIKYGQRGDDDEPASGAGGDGSSGFEQPVVAPASAAPSDLSGSFARQRRRLMQSEQCRQSLVVYELRVADLDSMQFHPDQLVLFGGTSILMSSHGAGLGNIMWMKPGTGGMIEVQHNAQGNEHYQIMASLLNHRYTAVSSDGAELNVKRTLDALATMMDQMAD